MPLLIYLVDLGDLGVLIEIDDIDGLSELCDILDLGGHECTWMICLARMIWRLGCSGGTL